MRRIGGWALNGGILLALVGLALSGPGGAGRPAWAQAQVTATPRPDGSIVHTVQEGDTLFGLALLYGVSVDQIRTLNGLESDLLRIGQELLIVPAQATPTPPAPTPTAERTPGALCTGIFEDRNGNDAREEGEPWIAGVPIALITGRGLKEMLVSEAGQPICVDHLEPGYYVLAMEVPSGYRATGPTRREAWLPWGGRSQHLFGLQPAALAPVSPAPTPAQPLPSAGTGPNWSRIGEALMLAGGFLSLLVVGGAIGYWIGQRRMR